MRIAVFVLASLLSTSVLAQSSPSYHVTHTYLLGGAGSWDYVVPDPPSHRLYIARQNRLMVVDEDSGKLLGLFSPIGTNPQDDFFAEGSPGFFRELERRRLANNLISAEEFIAFLKADSTSK